MIYSQGHRSRLMPINKNWNNIRKYIVDIDEESDTRNVQSKKLLETLNFFLIHSVSRANQPRRYRFLIERNHKRGMFDYHFERIKKHRSNVSNPRIYKQR